MSKNKNEKDEKDKNELPPIDMIRTYQSVTFDGKNETYFSHRDLPSKKSCEITVNKEYQGVEIQNDRDHIMVPFTNISCINFLSTCRKEQIQKAEDAIAKKSGIKASEIKRPR